MKKFLLKYWWPIFLVLFVTVMLFFFGPNEEKYYLEEDIQQYKHSQLSIIIFKFGIVIFIIYLLIAFIIIRQIKGVLLSSLMAIIYITVFLFVGRTMIFDCLLYINRHINNGTVTKSFLVSYWDGEKSKKNFILWTPNNKFYLHGNVIKNEFFNDTLNRGDTVHMTLNKGILDIPFSSKKLYDEK